MCLTDSSQSDKRALRESIKYVPCKFKSNFIGDWKHNGIKQGTRSDKHSHLFYINPTKLPERYLATAFEFFRGEDLLRQKTEEFYPNGFDKTESIKRSQQAALIIATTQWVPVKTTHSVRQLMETHNLLESDFQSLEESQTSKYKL